MDLNEFKEMNLVGFETTEMDPEGERIKELWCSRRQD